MTARDQDKQHRGSTRPKQPSSWLYVPGHQPELFKKAIISSAEALIFDLEDSVPIIAKEQARVNLREWLKDNHADSNAGYVHGKPVWVRINADYISEDLAALLSVSGESLCAGVILAKAEPDSAATLNHITRGSLDVIGLIESATGLKNIDQMTRLSSLVTFGLGEVDLLADLRIERSAQTEAALDAIRLRIVLTCAEAGLEPPIAPTSTDIEDMDTFARTTKKFLGLGFRGRTAIHPKQCAVINETFLPSSEEIAVAQDIVERFEQASDGLTVDLSGRLIDAAVVRGARELLERAARRH